VARLDERLKHEIERAARPADPSGVYERLIRRRERRHIIRRIEAGVIALALFAATIVGFYLLVLAIPARDASRPVAPIPSLNGVIVFSTLAEGEGDVLMAVEADGTNLRRLTPEGTADYRSPDVSPDGRTVVVAHSIPSFNEGEAVLATVPIEGGSPTWLTDNLTKGPWQVQDPSWSPDGRMIAFAGSTPSEATRVYGIYVFEMATGEARLIPGTDSMLVGNPTWSPDGGTIAFEGAVPDPGDPRSFPWDIYSVRLDGSQLMNLTRTPDEGETSPAWSWTTDRIAFVRRGEAPGLFTMAADGSGEILIFDGLPNLASPAWSPDGTLLAFTADTAQVYTIPADGGTPSAVTGALGEPAWQTLPTGATTSVPTSVPPTPDSAQDIGLGFPVCDVTSVLGEFAPGVTGTAVVATKTGDTGRCPTDEGGDQLVAVDVTGDGLSDASFGPIECEPFCTAFAAPDVDGDGTDELLVQNVQFTIVGLRLFDILGDGDGPALVMPMVEPPGDPAGATQGFDGSAPPQFWIGGDAFIADALRCETGPGGRVLISTTAESLPHDSPDAVWRIHETTLVLDGGVLRVVEVRDLEEPAGPVTTPSFMSTSGCGADLRP